MPTVKLDEFTEAYIRCALWSSTDGSDDDRSLGPGDPPNVGPTWDHGKTIDDLAPETLAEMVADCEQYQASARGWITGREAQAGHDFWLTRNGHGAGFWDGDWNDDKDTARYLDDLCEPYGEYDLYLSDDGKVYGI